MSLPKAVPSLQLVLGRAEALYFDQVQQFGVLCEQRRR
jgi:hypothetical protein